MGKPGEKHTALCSMCCQKKPMKGSRVPFPGGGARICADCVTRFIEATTAAQRRIIQQAACNSHLGD